MELIPLMVWAGELEQPLLSISTTHILLCTFTSSNFFWLSRRITTLFFQPTWPSAYFKLGRPAAVPLAIRFARINQPNGRTKSRIPQECVKGAIRVHNPPSPSAAGTEIPRTSRTWPNTDEAERTMSEGMSKDKAMRLKG